MARIRSDRLKELVRQVITTRDEGINCDTCFDQLDQFVELKLDGKDVAQAMPLVQTHLDSCGDCCEQYEALLEALQNIDATQA